MNQAENEVLSRAGEALGDMGLSWELLEREPTPGSRRRDGDVTLRYPGGQVELVAEVKIRPRKEQLAGVLDELRRHGRSGLLVADYVNPRLGEWLREQGVMFLDAAGNAHLRNDDLYVWVSGRRDELRFQAERERRRAFQPSGLKLVFALLCRPGLVAADYRTLASAAGVALGTVQWVIRDLVEEGYVLRLGRRRRRLVEPAALLEAWIPAYLGNLRPRLLLGRFDAPAIGWWKEIDPRAYGAQWGGEPAAAVLTSHLEPGTLTLYAAKIPSVLVAERKLVLDDSGRIDFRRKFWSLEEDATLGTVPSILTYADLRALGDSRTLEVAERVFRKSIDGLLDRHLADAPR